MMRIKVLVVELVAIDGLTSTTIRIGEIASLSHKARNNAMEKGASVVEEFSFSTLSLLTSAESTEILRSQRSGGIQVHSNAATFSFLSTDAEIHENT